MKTENNTHSLVQSVSRDNVAKVTHKFDALKMLFGKPLEMENGMMIYQPTIGDILNVGEQEFYSTLYIFISNPTTYRVQLWDMTPRIDWNKISDYELFMMLVKTANHDSTKILFGDDLDFQHFDMYGKNVTSVNDDGEEVTTQVPVLYNKDADILIEEEDYSFIADYLRTMFKIFPKIEHAKGKNTKQAIIDEERINMQAKAKKPDENSGLIALVSACTNHPGFKHKLRELEEVGICEFMDSVQRLQIYEQSTALQKGLMGGFVDGSKIKAEDYNWMRPLPNY